MEIVLTLRASLGIPHLTMRRESVRGILRSYRVSCRDCAYVHDYVADARDRGRDRDHARHESVQPRDGVRSGGQYPACESHIDVQREYRCASWFWINSMLIVGQR